MDSSLLDSIGSYHLEQALRSVPINQYAKLACFLQEVPRFTTSRIVQKFIAQYYERMKLYSDAMPEDHLALLEANVRFRTTNHEMMAFSLGEMWRRKELLSPEHHVQILNLLSEAGIFIEEILTYLLQSIHKSPSLYHSTAPALAYYIGRLKPIHGVMQISQLLRPLVLESREEVAMWAAGNVMVRGQIDLIELKKLYDNLPASKSLSIAELIFLKIVNPDGTLNAPKPTLKSLFSISETDQTSLRKLLSGLDFKELAGVGTSIGPFYFPEKRKFLWPTTQFSRNYMSESLRGDFQFYKESLLREGFDVVEMPISSLLQLSEPQLHSLLFP